MIWVIFAVLTAGAIVAITRKLRRAPASDDARVSEIEACKLQLQELDREEERRTIGKDEAQQTRAEVARRLLKANRQNAGAAPEKTKVLNAAVPAIAVAALISLGTIGTYVYYGKPGLSDQPLEARLSAPLEDQNLDIQVANMERRLRQNPADVTGWAALASIYFKSGLFEKAADTYQRAIDAGGQTESMYLSLAESLAFANDGVITDQAAQALQAALRRNPNSLRGRFWNALLAEQDGKKADAEKIYRDLLAGQIPSALKNIVTQRLEALTAPADTASEEIKGTGESATEERSAEQKMIRGMVDRLAARLEKDKSDLEGWLMLIRSYAVLKQADKAKAAMTSAREQFASDAKALEQIDAITKELNFAFAAGNASAPPQETAASQQPAAVPLEGGTGTMIRGMVEGLAQRLKENKSDLDGWLKLIRSYAVLKETDKAQDAVATARQEFASDAKALEKIDALTQGLGLAMPGASGGQPKS